MVTTGYDTIQLLEECSSGCRMALSNMKHLQKNIENSHFRKLVDGYITSHTRLKREADALLGEQGRNAKEPNPSASVFSWGVAEMKMMVKKDDSQIAKLMMDGCSMGIQTLSHALNQYAHASLESISLVDCIIKKEEDFLEEAKQFR